MVKEGGLAAVLMFLDFFSTNVQRTAVKTAANCCRGMQHDNIAMVKDILPNLENILQYSDQKIVEQVCLCFVRLADSFKSNAAHLQVRESPLIILSRGSVYDALLITLRHSFSSLFSLLSQRMFSGPFFRCCRLTQMSLLGENRFLNVVGYAIPSQDRTNLPVIANTE